MKKLQEILEEGGWDSLTKKKRRIPNSGLVLIRKI
jgi:hypothetical protein